MAVMSATGQFKNCFVLHSTRPLPPSLLPHVRMLLLPLAAGTARRSLSRLTCAPLTASRPRSCCPLRSPSSRRTPVPSWTLHCATRGMLPVGMGRLSRGAKRHGPARTACCPRFTGPWESLASPRMRGGPRSGPPTPAQLCGSWCLQRMPRPQWGYMVHMMMCYAAAAAFHRWSCDHFEAVLIDLLPLVHRRRRCR